MKRIVLIGSAVAGLFTAGITTVASAATTRSSSRATNVTLKREAVVVHARLTCRFTLTAVAPAGSTAFTPGSSAGSEYGPTNCGGATTGVTDDTFTTAGSGDLTGTIQHWFGSGRLDGTFSLTPSAPSGPPTTTSFADESYTGTVTITGGRGLLLHTTGTGTLACATTDGVHFTCTERLKLAQKVIKLVTVRSHHR